MTFYEPHPTCQIPNLPALYEDLFGRTDCGQFVEVGAYDGETYSNTSFLADLGWRGLYLEPITEQAAACALRHLRNFRTRMLPVAAAAHDGMIELLVRGPLTTGSPAVAALHDRLAWADAHRHQGRRMVPCRRLGPLLEQAGYPADFDLLVVDVEGAEADVIAGLDLSRWRPRAMIVELHEGNPEHEAFANESRALRAAIETAGYEVIYADQINTVFRCRDRHPADGRRAFVHG